MMRRLLISLLFVSVCALIADCQVHVNAVFNPQLNTGPSLRAGVDIDILVSEKIFFMPGVYLSRRTYAEEYETAYPDGSSKSQRYDDRADFLQVPLRFALGFKSANNKLETRLMAGPYVAYGLCGRTKHKTIKKDYDKDCNYIENSEVHTEDDVFGKDGAWRNRWDVGMTLGLDFYVRQHWVIGAFSEIGFVKGRRVHNGVASAIDEILLGGLNKRNFAVGLILGYRF